MDPDPISIKQMNSLQRETEFVERKGIGHPDSLCDGVAEAVSKRLCEEYRSEFDNILHHNTDKVQLVAGNTEPEYGGGEIVKPVYVLIGGRATKRYNGQEIPVDDIAVQAANEYIGENIGELKPSMIEFESRIGETSTDLKSIFNKEGVPLANDTSVGVGYAPLSETERIVRTLDGEIHEEVEEVGKDVKVMGLRKDDKIQITVAAAVISRYVSDINEYLEVKERVEEVSREHAEERTNKEVEISVNSADDIENGSVYITVTGLSAEMGDDGAVGRGNRANGLITPHRSMSLEAVSGKNPVSHVGKLYNIFANKTAERIHDELGAKHTEIKILSKIGVPITQPQSVDVETTAPDKNAVHSIVRGELENIVHLTDEIVDGEIPTF